MPSKTYLEQVKELCGAFEKFKAALMEATEAMLRLRPLMDKMEKYLSERGK